MKRNKTILSWSLALILMSGVLLVSQLEWDWSFTPGVSWAGQVAFKPGEAFRDRLQTGKDGPEMVVIPAGRFRRGDIEGKHGNDERPVRTVVIQRPFAISRYEITFDQYDEFAKATDPELPEDDCFGRSRRPVIRVYWDDAVIYAEWLSRQAGKRYRLPSEAEWEYAARAGTETAYWWGNELKQGLANCIGCGSQWDGKQTASVGSFKPNPFGLYDTSGNVSEWVQDCWHENYEGAPTEGSAWEEKNGGDCGRRVVRGGSWFRAHDWARSSHRFSNRPSFSGNAVGFRVVREIEKAK